MYKLRLNLFSYCSIVSIHEFRYWLFDQVHKNVVFEVQISVGCVLERNSGFSSCWKHIKFVNWKLWAYSEFHYAMNTYGTVDNLGRPHERPLKLHSQHIYYNIPSLHWSPLSGIIHQISDVIRWIKPVILTTVPVDIWSKLIPYKPLLSFC